MLSVAAGVSVSTIAGKYVFKNAAGEVILEANVDAVDGLVSGGKSHAYSNGLILKGEYTEEYSHKLQETYKIFKDKGYEMSEHSLNRVLGRVHQGKINSIDEVIDTLNNGTVYHDIVNGGTVIYANGISIHITEDETIKTVIGNAKLKSTWEEIE